MKSVIASLVAVAGMSAAANAIVNTSITWQVSTDNTNWSFDVDVPNNANTLVYVRGRVSYAGTAAPLGLASLIFQPTVSNWDNTDALSAFVNGGQGSNTSSPTGVVTNQTDVTQFGRVSPWGRSSLGSTNFVRGFANTSVGQPAGGWLRIAQAQVTAWIGGTGNTTGGSGVPIAQLANVGRTASDPAFNSSINNIVVFKMGLTINGAVASRTQLDVDSPTAGFGNLDSASGERQVYWWADMNELTGSIRGAATVVPGHIHITPTPGALALLGLGGIAAGRRRR